MLMKSANNILQHFESLSSPKIKDDWEEDLMQHIANASHKKSTKMPLYIAVILTLLVVTNAVVFTTKFKNNDIESVSKIDALQTISNQLLINTLVSNN